MSEAKVTLPYKFREIKLSTKDIERFWSRVDKKGKDDCWDWTGCKNGSGYGYFSINGESVCSHRVAWIIENGDQLNELYACHKCDNRTCCNPSHIFLGTHADNMADRQAKGRAASGDFHGSRLHPERVPRGDDHWSKINPEKRATGDRNGSRRRPESRPRGESHKRSVLTNEIVKSIRSMYASGEYTQKQIANIYSVSSPTINRIVNNKEWTHI